MPLSNQDWMHFEKRLDDIQELLLLLLEEKPFKPVEDVIREHVQKLSSMETASPNSEDTSSPDLTGQYWLPPTPPSS